MTYFAKCKINCVLSDLLSDLLSVSLSVSLMFVSELEEAGGVHGEGAEQDQAVRAAVRQSCRQLGQNVSQCRAAQCTWALAFGILLSCSTCGIVLNKFIVSKEAWLRDWGT